MKKNYLFINGAHKWNSLVYKFIKLYRRMRLLNGSNNFTEREYSRIIGKMQKLYKRLEKMQYKVGLRIAGTALAVMLSAGTANAQEFAPQDTLKGISRDIDVSFNSAPAFADLDGDGDLDMYVGNMYGEVIHYENDGNGIFTEQDTLRADGSVIDVGNNSAPAFADLDGDGDLDLYVGDAGGKIHIYQNDGTGTFSANNFLQADAADIDVEGAAKFVFADFDGDNDLDLFIGDYYSDGGTNKYGYIKYYQNDGTGTFTANGNLEANGSEIQISYSLSNPNLSPAFADFDDDGDLDLYIASNNRNILYYENNGTETEPSLAAGVNMKADGVDISVLSSYPTITFADINGDGTEDLFIGQQEGVIEYYKNDGTGTFSTESYFQELLTSNIKNRFMSPEFADLDGNGILDLYTGTLKNNLLYYENDGNMLFGFHSNVKDSILGNRLSPAFADLDGDGDLDLYIGTNNGYIKYYQNDGTGMYTFIGNVQAGGSDISLGYPVSPVFADIDEDGDLDLYVGNYYGNIYFYENNGGGVFSSGVILEADGASLDAGDNAAPAFADIDNDGDLDLFVGNNAGNINYYTNNGSGVFSSQGLLQADGIDISVTSYSDPTFADLDNDGDLDLFVGSDLGYIFYYKNLSLISNAGEDAEELCSLSYTLHANQPDAGKTGTWSIQSGGTGNFDDANAYNATFTADAESVYVLRWTVSDGSNTVFDDVQITFAADDINPTITCVGNQTVDADSNHNYTVSGTEFDPTETSDNCNVASVVNDFNNSSTLADAVLPEGTTTVQWTVTDDAGNTQVCSFDILVNAFVGVENIDKNTVSIFPNPVNDKLTINFGNYSDDGQVKIRINDISGKTVLEQNALKNPEIIDLSSLKKGVYLINIISKSEVSTVKLLKD